jgi:hypothetical protein
MGFISFLGDAAERLEIGSSPSLRFEQGSLASRALACAPAEHDSHATEESEQARIVLREKSQIFAGLGQMAEPAAISACKGSPGALGRVRCPG